MRAILFVIFLFNLLISDSVRADDTIHQSSYDVTAIVNIEDETSSCGIECPLEPDEEDVVIESPSDLGTPIADIYFHEINFPIQNFYHGLLKPPKRI